MKVLHVYRTYFPDPPGGIQEAVRQICLSTASQGIDSTVFALSPNPHPARLVRPEANVERARSWAAPASCDLGGPAAVHLFRRLAAEADVIHYLFPWPYADVLRLCTARKPSVLTYVSDIVRQKWLGALYQPLMWRTLSGMDVIVANAPAYAAGSPVLADARIVGRLRQIPLGIEETSYAVEPDACILDRLGLNAGEPFVLFVGAFRYYKGLDVLLEAAGRVNGKLVIAGSDPQGDALRSKADALKLSNVIFAGPISDAEKISLLRACRAFVLPSHLRAEAFGMVLVEASMFARPMVSCEIGTGTSFVNQAGETGFVVPPASPEPLAAALNRLLADEALAATMGLNARKRYETHFSGPVLGKAYADAFHAAALARA